MSNPIEVAALSTATVFLLMALGVPVFASLGLSGMLGLYLVQDSSFLFNVLKDFLFDHTASYVLIVVPLFILMGNLALYAGVGDSLFRMAKRWFGHYPGGLLMATIMTCGGFSATSGSSVATAATVGSITLPELRKEGYDRKISAGAVAAGGVLGVLIPPSVLLVFYAALTNVSAGSMLLAGLVPGILSVAVFLVGVLVISLISPDLSPRSRKSSWPDRLKSLRHGWRMLVLSMVVLGGIYSGWVTPSEAAALGATTTFLFLMFTRRDTRAKARDVGKAFRSSIDSTVMIMMTMLGAALFSFFLSLIQVPQILSAWVTDQPISPLMVIAAMLLIYIPLGMFLDAFSMLVITLPIMSPVVAALGYDPIWFGILAVKMCEIGLITPPIGLNVFVIAGIDDDISLTDAFIGVSPFLLMEILTVILIFSFPWLATWLPSFI